MISAVLSVIVRFPLRVLFNSVSVHFIFGFLFSIRSDSDKFYFSIIFRFRSFPCFNSVRISTRHIEMAFMTRLPLSQNDGASKREI